MPDAINGLQVAAALRLLFPGLPAVLLTGYASGDLREAAERMGVAFLEKPLAADGLERALNAALAAPGRRDDHLAAAAHVATDGRIVSANPAAQALILAANQGLPTQQLADVWGPDVKGRLHKTFDRWVSVKCRDETQQWIVRSRLLPDASVLMVFRGQRQPNIENLPLAQLLLRSHSDEAPRWPFAGRALVVSEASWLRQMLASYLSWVGAICHSAATNEEASQLFWGDPAVEVILFLTSSGQGDPPAPLVELARQRLNCILVRAGQAADGLPAMSSLMSGFSSGQLGVCANCGLPVRLRPSAKGDAAPGECACGRRAGS